MKLEIQPRDDHQVNVIAEFETELLEQFKRRSARKIAEKTRIPGFRPGKAPYDVVRRVVGEEALIEQAIEDLIDEYYPKILEEASLKPGAAGNLEKILSLDPPKFSFLVPLEPEVDLGNYKDIRLEYSPQAVEEQEVTDFLKRLQTNYATAEPVDRPAQEGDLVYIKFSGKLTHPAEGEDEMVFPERPAQFILGSDLMENRSFPFPGFSENLTGKKEGDAFTLTYTFPQDEKDEALRGKEVEFQVTVQSVKSLILPELNDEFAQTIGQFETLEDLKKAIREQLENAKKEEADETFFNQLFERLQAQATIKYPPQVLEHEIEHLLEDFQHDLSRQGMELDTYLKMVNKDRETFIREELEPIARRRLERSLIMEKFADVEQIKIDETNYQQAIQDSLRDLQSMPMDKKPTKAEQNQLTQEVLIYNINRRLNQMILNRMKAIATGQALEEQPAEQGLASESSTESDSGNEPVQEENQDAPAEE
ncbi:trigger factor [Bellilinea caldifistulae]|uniref:trigger factor n=1 Tax=Bellilinea caldifistulae TaxID=360411 RepID=UPI0007858C73|nr:trigger factor [Bellilinea caldifistulae]